jgi:hypothetical protein
LRQDETRVPWDEGDPHQHKPPTLKARIGAALLAFAFCVFAAGGLASGCLFVNTLSDVLSDHGSGVSLPVVVPGIAAARPSETPRPGQPTAKPGMPTSTPIPGVAAATIVPTRAPTELPNWRGNERVTFLLLGLDMREDERGTPTRSDTMILVTIDPATKHAGMLTIPRDLWVPIPDHGSNKINTAHFFGEVDEKGGGPELARQTVELNFGVRVHYWAVVDFTGFVDLINAVDGITVDAPFPI